MAPLPGCCSSSSAYCGHCQNFTSNVAHACTGFMYTCLHIRGESCLRHSLSRPVSSLLERWRTSCCKLRQLDSGHNALFCLETRNVIICAVGLSTAWQSDGHINAEKPIQQLTEQATHRTAAGCSFPTRPCFNWSSLPAAVLSSASTLSRHAADERCVPSMSESAWRNVIPAWCSAYTCTTYDC